MNVGKAIAVVASMAIVSVMGYMAFSETSPSEAADTDEVHTDNSAQQDRGNQKRAPSEEEKTIQQLKESTQPREYEVSSLYLRKCSACHGDSGRGTVGPSLVGKTEEEIVGKLHDYKEGKVKNTLMKGIFANSSEEELRSLAREISTFGK